MPHRRCTKYECVSPLDADFSKRRHIKEADAISNREVLLLLVFEPVLPLPAVAILALLALSREPIGPLPSRNFAEDCAASLQVLVKWGASYTTRRRHLPIGEMIGVQKTERLGNPVLEIESVLLERLGTADIYFPQIEWRASPSFIHWASAMPAPPEETMPIEL